MSLIFRTMWITSTILTLFSLVTVSFPIGYDSSELLNPSTLTEKEPASDFTIQLQDELSSILLCDNGLSHYELDHDIVIVPRSQITERTLNGLGYRDLVKYAKKFKYTNQVFKSHLDILIPERTVPYFIFNTSDPLSVPKSQSRMEYANFIDHSAPFTLPEFSALVDYLLILPISSHSGFDPDQLSNHVLTARSSKLPMFTHAVREGTPLIVFLFKSGTDAIESNEHSIPLMHLKSIVTDHELNGFFDAFARTWVDEISMSQLVHGVFCTVNVGMKKHSYCLKIKDDLNNLVLFPAYEHIPLRSKREEVRFDAISGMRLLIQKRSERINAKMIPNANHLTVYEPIEELTIPLSIIKENQPDDSRYSGYTPSTRKEHSTILSSKDIHVDKKLSLQRRGVQAESDEEMTRSRIEEIREHLEDRLYQKQIKDKKIRDSGDTYVKSKAESLLLDSASSRSSLSPSKSRSGMSVKDSRRKYRSAQSGKVPSDGEDIAHEWSEKLRKDKQNHANVVKVKSNVTSNGNSVISSPVTNTAHTTALGSSDCEPITWFNVFHHSVFGKTKFCGV